MSERTQAEYRWSDPHAQIASIVAGWTQSWNAHDAAALSSLVAADVDFVNVKGQWLQGAEEFEQLHRSIHLTQLRRSVWSTGHYRLRPLADGLVLVHLEWMIDGDWRRTEARNRHETEFLPGLSRAATGLGGSSLHTTRIWRAVLFIVWEVTRHHSSRPMENACEASNKPTADVVGASYPFNELCIGLLDGSCRRLSEQAHSLACRRRGRKRA